MSSVPTKVLAPSVHSADRMDRGCRLARGGGLMGTCESRRRGLATFAAPWLGLTRSLPSQSTRVTWICPVEGDCHQIGL